MLDQKQYFTINGPLRLKQKHKSTKAMTTTQKYSDLWKLSRSRTGNDFKAFTDLHKQVVNGHHGGLESELDLSLEAMDHDHFVSFWTAANRKPFFPRERASKSDAQLQDFNQYHGKA